MLPTTPAALPSPPGPIRWACLLALLIGGTQTAGLATVQILGAPPLSLTALAVTIVAALVGGGIALAVLERLVLAPSRRSAGGLPAAAPTADTGPETAATLASHAEAQQRLRHDLRGALSPALLIADRLVSHEDPKVRRAGEVVVKSVERASALLSEPTDGSHQGAASPRAGP